MPHLRPRSPAKTMARTTMIVLLAATVLVAVAGPLSTQDESPTNVDGMWRSPAPADPRRGMRIHLDAQGRPTATPPSDSPAAVRSSSVTAAPPPHLVEVDSPLGGKMVVLDGRFQPYAVAHIRPDGTVAVGCERTGDHGHTTENHAGTCSAEAEPTSTMHDTGAAR